MRDSLRSAVPMLQAYASWLVPALLWAPGAANARPPLVTASPAPAVCRGLLDQALDRELTPETVEKLQKAGTFLLTFPQTEQELRKTEGFAMISLAALSKRREELPWNALLMVERPGPTLKTRPRTWALPSVFPGRTVKQVMLKPGAPPSPTSEKDPQATYLQKGYFFIPLTFLVAPEHPVELAIRWGKSGEATVIARLPLPKNKIPPFIQKLSKKRLQALLKSEKQPAPETIVAWLKRDECF